MKTKYTLGQRAADLIANFCGSWTFILVTIAFCLIYMAYNTIYPNPFDKFPYVFLNLLLGFASAFSAPVILMAGNRQQELAKATQDKDLNIDIKMSAEVKLIHQKLDAIIGSKNEPRL